MIVKDEGVWAALSELQTGELLKCNSIDEALAKNEVAAKRVLLSGSVFRGLRTRGRRVEVGLRKDLG